MSIDQKVLDELRKIREALAPKPTRAPPKGLWPEFMDFIGKVVSALVNDIIMPIPGAFIRGTGGKQSSAYQ